MRGSFRPKGGRGDTLVAFPIADTRTVCDCRAMRTIWSIRAAAAILGASLLVSNASGLTTVCSKPHRAGVKRIASLSIPWAKVPSLKSWLEQHSEKSFGMSLSSVESGQDGKPFDKETLILQSPKVSVIIIIEAKSGGSTARASVERTCINDAFEPWPPYWHRFLIDMKAAGFVFAEKRTSALGQP